MIGRAPLRAPGPAMVVSSSPDVAAHAGAVAPGLYPADDFVTATGNESSIGAAAKFYFAHEWIAVPRDGVPVAGFARGLSAVDDVRAWSASRESAASPGARPALVWIAAPDRVRGARVGPDSSTVTIDGREHPLTLAPRLEANRSWFDASSAAFFAGSKVAMRGQWRDLAFEARTLWPEDFRLDDAALVEPLPSGGPASQALRELVRAGNGGARDPFAMRLLWKRESAVRAWAGKPAIVVMVNGAQGDDDEAWGGHFALGTGRIDAGGGLPDVLVNNFYSLDVVSEKGILAAPVPLDNYLADLNSGQAWYRPSAMLVCVLADAAAAARMQSALNRVYAQFWRHQLPYRHATMNCTGISVDTLRALGLKVPANEPGAASVARGWFAIPWSLAKERSVAQARMAFEYLTQDRTRLFPAVAFETIGAEFLRIAAQGAREAGSDLERLLARDLEAVVFMRIPQLPSARVPGSWPVASPAEYHGKVPRDPADVKIVPAPPRPFPSHLRDDDLLPEAPRPSDRPLAIWAALATVVVVALAVGLSRGLSG